MLWRDPKKANDQTTTRKPRVICIIKHKTTINN